MKTKVIGLLNIKGMEIIRRVYDPEFLAPTISTCGGGQREPKVMETNNKTKSMTGGENANIRIRKLTPKECWRIRLMGFDDEDFENAQKVNSDTQLYRQAGNSIVVNVLMEIFREML